MFRKIRKAIRTKLGAIVKSAVDVSNIPIADITVNYGIDPFGEIYIRFSVKHSHGEQTDLPVIPPLPEEVSYPRWLQVIPWGRWKGPNPPTEQDWD